MQIDKLVEALHKEIASSRGGVRTGDYRIGLRRAIDIAYDMMEGRGETDNLVGRKMRGFKFEPIQGLAYPDNMDKYIGEVGVITETINRDVLSVVMVRFRDGVCWRYPLHLAIEHLIPNE